MAKGIDTIIKVSGTISASATSNDIASIDIPEDGNIVCVGGAIVGIYAPTIGAANTNQNLQLMAELSFLSTNQISTNDARGSIAGVAVSSAGYFAEAVETGGSGFKLSEQDSICLEGGIIVNAGERIHLHGYSSTVGLTATATFLLYITTAGGGRRAIKRR